MAAGRKTGGRKAGVPNKRTQAVQERLEAMDWFGPRFSDQLIKHSLPGSQTLLG